MFVGSRPDNFPAGVMPCLVPTGYLGIHLFTIIYFSAAWLVATSTAPPSDAFTNSISECPLPDNTPTIDSSEYSNLSLNKQVLAGQHNNSTPEFFYFFIFFAKDIILVAFPGWGQFYNYIVSYGDQGTVIQYN